MSLIHTSARLVAASLALAAVVAAPAHADVKGSAIQSSNIQAMPGQQLDSAAVKRVYCDLKTTGLNHVTLNPVLIQDTITSSVITKRKAKKGGVAATATDNQFRQAIRNARACGLGVIIKPHLELVSTEWRAHIVGSDAEQKAWTRWLLAYQKIGIQEGADTLVIGVEQKGMTLTKAATARWLGTIAQLRAADPKHKMKITYAAHASDEVLLLDPTWVKKLDYLSVTWYPRIHEKDATYASVKKSMNKDHAIFTAAWKRYKQPMVIAETGIRSISYKDRFARSDAELAAAKADEKLQEIWYHAMLHDVDGWDHVNGVMLYRVYNDRTGDARLTNGTAGKTFTWQGKPAEQTIAGYFGGKVPTR